MRRNRSDRALERVLACAFACITSVGCASDGDALPRRADTAQLERADVDPAARPSASSRDERTTQHVSAAATPALAPQDAALASELIALGSAEQALRRKLIEQRAAPDPATERELAELDASNTRRLIEIVDAGGWPTRARVGAPASGAAWLILQHSPDQAFQQRMLPELERLMRAGDVRGQEYALLYDRVQLHAGKPQRYGSRFVTRDGVMSMHECEDPAHLDERRASVGLGPIAEYVKLLEDTYHAQIARPLAR